MPTKQREESFDLIGPNLLLHLQHMLRQRLRLQLLLALHLPLLLGGYADHASAPLPGLPAWRPWTGARWTCLDRPPGQAGHQSAAAVAPAVAAAVARVVPAARQLLNTAAAAART